MSMKEFIQISSYINLFSFLTIFFVLVTKKKNKNITDYSFISFTFFVIVWQTALLILLYFTKSSIDAFYWQKIIEYSSILTAISLYCFLFLYTKNRNLIIYLLGIVPTILVVGASCIWPISFIPEPVMFFNYWANKGPLFLPYFLLLSSLYSIPLLYCLVNYIRSRALTDLLLVIALIICISGGFTNWFLWFDISIPPFGMISLSIYASILVFLLLKHELMGISVIINRTAARIFTNILLISIYCLTTYVYHDYTHKPIDHIWLLMTICIGVMVGELYHVIREFIQTGAVDKWLKDKYDPIALEHEISQKLISIFTNEGVLKTVATIFKNRLQISRVEALLHDPFKNTYSALFSSDNICISESNALIKIFHKEKNVIYNTSYSRLLRYIKVAGHFFGNIIKFKVNLSENIISSKKLLRENILREKLLNNPKVISLILQLGLDPKESVFIPMITSDLQDSTKSILAGIIILDKRNSELAYTQADLKVFESIVLQAQLALDRIPYFEKLEKAKEDLEKSDKFKTELLDTLSHELRTPFTQIIGGNKDIEQKLLEYIETPVTDLIKNLESIPSDKKGAKSEAVLVKTMSTLHEIHKNMNAFFQPSIKGVIRSADRLFEKIDNILKVASLKASKSNLSLDYIQFYDVKSWITKFLETHADLYAHLTLDFQMNIDLREPFITDREALFSILYNLLLNAFNFTKTGSVLLSLSLANETVTIVVKDTGIGISVSEQYKIFEPLHQAKTGLNRDIQGQGLGLYIVKEYVKLLHGHILLKSTMDKGTTVTIQLPCSDTQKIEDPFVIQKTDFIGMNIQSVRLLVCDDDDGNISFMQAALSDALSLVTVTDGKSAIELVKENAFDLIFMDIQMPNMDGMEVLKEIREFDKDTPVIAFTAQAMKGDRNRFLIAGFDEYYSKPVDLDNIETFIRKMMYMKNKNLFQKYRKLREQLYAQWVNTRTSDKNILEIIAS